ncbi:MAG: hypothetical protein JNK14_13225 [Chitinophagaceae bacterium]|nr:hypothetical protein [Chitinophagaceae bacterium]
MRALLLKSILAAACTITLFACSKNTPTNTDPCNGTSARSFATDVNPIIQTYCNKAGCHAPGSVNGPGSLTNYAEVFGARTVIRPAIASGLMPQDATLTLAQRNIILCWIDSGAPNN